MVGDIKSPQSRPPTPDELEAQQPMEDKVSTGDLVSTEPQGPPLPPADGGAGAWSFLAAATVIEVGHCRAFKTDIRFWYGVSTNAGQHEVALMIQGFASSYGVFLDYYNVKYPQSKSKLPIVGTIATGEMYLLLGPLTLLLISRPRWRSPCVWAGLVTMSSALIGAAFSKDVNTLIVTQGVLYGMGGTMLYCTATSLMFDWWQCRRGFASGIMLSGTGLGGLVMPFISAALLERFGQRTTLLSIAVGYTILFAVVIPFVRPRTPIKAIHAASPPKLNLSFMSGRSFWVLWLGVLFQGLAAFMPLTYLPAYATALGLPANIGTLSIALMNLARVPGQIAIGYASDKVGARTLILIMSIASGLSVLTGWGLAHDAGGILGFAIAFGGFAGSYTALFTSFIKAITIIYAMFFFARGMGSIASGQLSVPLLALSSDKVHLGAAGWGALILWTGAGMIASGVGAGYKGLKRD